MATLFVLMGIAMFIGLVVIHELGHFLVAKRNGVEVEEFGIGFPPRAKILKKVKGTVYSLNWLPLGGFVKLKGEHDSDKSPGSFGAASLWSKTKILLAGVTMNFLAAAIILTGLAWTGLPKTDLQSLPFYDKDQFSVSADTEVIKSQVLVGVLADSPAAEAGLQSGDEIIRIGQEPVRQAENLPAITKSYQGETVEIIYRRDNGPEQTATATLASENAEQGVFLGVAPINNQVIKATWSAPVVGFVTAAQYVDVSYRGLGFLVQNLFEGRTQVAQDSVAGPVGVFKVISDTASAGFGQLMFIIALVSISLAVMNALPIPALDGGRLFVTLVFRTLKKPLTREREDMIHGLGFMFLMGLIILITFVDVKRFF